MSTATLYRCDFLKVLIFETSQLDLAVLDVWNVILENIFENSLLQSSKSVNSAEKIKFYFEFECSLRFRGFSVLKS